MSEFHATPNTVRHNHAERVFAEKLAADALNLRSVRTASVLVRTVQSEGYESTPQVRVARTAQES